MRAKNVALVPLRGGSKAIPGKNIKEIAGRPLCAWVLRAATDAARVDSVFVSTDCEKIKDTVLRLGLDIKVIDRPAEFATDEATTESVMLHFLEREPAFDRLVTIQATSPLLEGRHLDEALQRFEAEGYDSMVSAVRTKRFFWNDDGTPLNYDPSNRLRRQDFVGTLTENGAFYITKKTILASTRCRLGGRIGVFEMPPNTAAEIDESADWDTVARLIEERNGEGNDN